MLALTMFCIYLVGTSILMAILEHSEEEAPPPETPHTSNLCKVGHATLGGLQPADKW